MDSSKVSSDRTIATIIDNNDIYRAKLRTKKGLTKKVKALIGIHDALRDHINKIVIINDESLKEIKKLIFKDRNREKYDKDLKVYNQILALLKLIRLNQKLRYQKSAANPTEQISQKPSDTTLYRSTQNSQIGNTSDNFFSRFEKSSNTSMLDIFLEQSVMVCESNAFETQDPDFLGFNHDSKLVDKDLINVEVSDILKESKWLLDTYNGYGKTDKEFFSLNPDQLIKLSEKLKINEHQLKLILQSVIDDGIK